MGISFTSPLYNIASHHNISNHAGVGRRPKSGHTYEDVDNVANHWYKMDKLGDHTPSVDVGVVNPVPFSPTYQQPVLGTEADAYEVMKPSAPVMMTGLTTNDNVCYSNGH